MPRLGYNPSISTIIGAIIPADLILNDSPKITRIRQKYNIFS